MHNPMNVEKNTTSLKTQEVSDMGGRGYEAAGYAPDFHAMPSIISHYKLN